MKEALSFFFFGDNGILLSDMLRITHGTRVKKKDEQAVSLSLFLLSLVWHVCAWMCWFACVWRVLGWDVAGVCSVVRLPAECTWKLFEINPGLCWIIGGRYTCMHLSTHMFVRSVWSGKHHFIRAYVKEFKWMLSRRKKNISEGRFRSALRVGGWGRSLCLLQWWKRYLQLYRITNMTSFTGPCFMFVSGSFDSNAEQTSAARQKQLHNNAAVSGFFGSVLL